MKQVPNKINIENKFDKKNNLLNFNRLVYFYCQNLS